MPAGGASLARRGRPRPRSPPSGRPVLLRTSARWQAGRFEKEKTMEATEGSAPRSSRRSFLLTGAAAGATAAGGRLLSDPTPARAGGGLTPGDAAILRFLAALE